MNFPSNFQLNAFKTPPSLFLNHDPDQTADIPLYAAKSLCQLWCTCTDKCLNWQSDYADFKCYINLTANDCVQRHARQWQQPEPNTLPVSLVTRNPTRLCEVFSLRCCFSSKLLCVCYYVNTQNVCICYGLQSTGYHSNHTNWPPKHSSKVLTVMCN